MPIIIGIDTGGTYTDGVVLDTDTKTILAKAKSPTTRPDLLTGIQACLRQLQLRHFREHIKTVCFSTTLATNALVEGRFCPTGLLLIGGDAEEYSEYTVKRASLRGKLDIKGRELTGIRPDEVRGVLSQWRDQVESVAISGYASVRNPMQELAVKDAVNQLLGVPVVCAHELTGALGFHQRTVTAVLNAGLIPLIRELLKSLREALRSFDIQAPVMVVKGNGNLMQDSYAWQRPIETILSGPAASVAGGLFLSGEKNAMLVDIGGTTTDIAMAKEGRVLTKKAGANIAGFNTCVEAIDARTFGIGGDSHLRIDRHGEILVGPRKVTPLCVAAYRFPEMEAMLRVTINQLHCRDIDYKLLDCFSLRGGNQSEIRDTVQETVLQALRRGVLSRYTLSQKVESGEALDSALERLEQSGVVERISLTPTDVLHANGSYIKWSRDISRAYIEAAADNLNLEAGPFLNRLRSAVVKELEQACLQSSEQFKISDTTPGEQQIVAVGAPSHAWMEETAQKLKSRLIVPEHAEVACAVGAAVGRIIETVEILIRPDHMLRRYIVYAPDSRSFFDTLDEAVSFAGGTALDMAREKAERAGGMQFELSDSRNDVFVSDLNGTAQKYVETRIIATAVEAS